MAVKQESESKDQLPEPNAIWLRIVPDLKLFRAMEQGRALKAAKSSSLKMGEVIVMIGWLLAVTSFTKFILVRGQMEADPAATLLAHLMITLPLLLIVFIPIQVRRVRRGIRQQFDKKETP